MTSDRSDGRHGAGSFSCLRDDRVHPGSGGVRVTSPRPACRRHARLALVFKRRRAHAGTRLTTAPRHCKIVLLPRSRYLRMRYATTRDANWRSIPVPRWARTNNGFAGRVARRTAKPTPMPTRWWFGETSELPCRPVEMAPDALTQTARSGAGFFRWRGAAPGLTDIAVSVLSTTEPRLLRQPALLAGYTRQPGTVVADEDAGGQFAGSEAGRPGGRSGRGGFPGPVRSGYGPGWGAGPGFGESLRQPGEFAARSRRRGVCPKPACCRTHLDARARGTPGTGVARYAPSMTMRNQTSALR